jgi:hypothetical protein
LLLTSGLSNLSLYKHGIPLDGYSSQPR